MRRVLKRRSFLGRCWKAAGAFLTPTSFREKVYARLADAQFHLHPYYREQTALDSAVLKIRPGLDSFASEQHNEKLAPILNTWTADLLESPGNLQSVARLLQRNFIGVAWQPVESHPTGGSSGGVTVERLTFSSQFTLQAGRFISEMQAAFGVFAKILTAELQITQIESSAGGVATRVRYELVGTGDRFFREQRTGHWLLDWAGNSQDGYQLTRWRMDDEVRCRAKERLFTDFTRAAFGGNPSYESQMMHGADYWRTTLDGASGIDIYGHNGVSVGDIDGDGHDDIYICQPAGLPNRLYRNLGDGTFEDITESSGVGVLENTACALFADFGNHGRQDLLVVRASGPLLFVNQGKGKFSLKANAFQFSQPPKGTFTGASAADYNRDGLLDVYFCLYTYYQGTDQYKYPTPYFAAENGPLNFLMHNNGDNTFRDVTAQCGLNQNNSRYSFCCGWADYNHDGWPDLYVVNDFGRKNLYRNNGDGTFTDMAASAGVEDVGAGMSVSWFDYDNDGAQDLYVANMWTAAGERITADRKFQETASATVRDLYRKHAMGNSLFKNSGSGFNDSTGKSQTRVGRWSWSSDVWDFDHDGFADIYIANGMISGPIREDLNSFFWREVVAKSPNTYKSDADYEQGWNTINEVLRSDYSWSGFERNILFANNRDGTFADVSGAVGLDFIEDSRSFALADFDGDGRQELLVKNRNAPQLRLMKNTLASLPPAICFRLQGTKSNRDAIGATLTIQTSAGQQTKNLQAGSGFLSQHSKELFFGLGSAKGGISATIRWPSGLLQNFKDLPRNHRIVVTEGEAKYRTETFKAPSATASGPQEGEALPVQLGTWLLTPVAAPKFGKAAVVCLRTRSSAAFDGNWPQDAPKLIEVVADEPENQDVSAVYNLLFRYLFDRHRDLPLPTSFLINEDGEIVKVYQGRLNAQTVQNDFANMPRSDADRVAKALPFHGVSSTYEYGRNYLSLGSIFFQRGYPDYAEDFFQSALKQDKTSAEACYGLGSVYLKQGRNQLAQESFEKAVRLPSTYPETTPNGWNNLGLLATRDGNTAKAIGYFEQAILVDPNHFIALENLGNAYKQEKRWDEARTQLEKALSIKPLDAEANYSLGMVFAQVDDTAKAYEYLKKALQTRPAYPEALNNLGILYLRTHRRDEAVLTFEQCIRVAPAFDQSYLNLARVYAIEGTTDNARGVLNALLVQHPDSAVAKKALAQLP